MGPSGSGISKDIATVAKEVHIATTMTPKMMNFRFQDFDNIRHNTSTIKCVHEDRLVAFEDGSSVYADVMIHCTGYKFHFPFLETKGIVSVEDNRVGALHKHVFPPPLAPWLSFVGLTFQDPIFYIIELQSRWVARVLSGKVELPSEEDMMTSVENFYQNMQQNGLPKRYTHHLSSFQAEYKHWLVEQIGLGPMKEWMGNMYSECITKFLEMQHNFRDHWDDAFWDSIIHSPSSPSSS